MSKLLKILIAILGVVVVGVGAYLIVPSLIGGGSDQPSGVITPPPNPPSSPDLIVQDTLDNGPSDSSDDMTHIELPEDQPGDGVQMPESEMLPENIGTPPGEEEGSESTGAEEAGDTGTKNTYTWVDLPTSEFVRAEQLTKRDLYGRWVVQKMGINVAVMKTSAQSAVNATDSAALFDHGESRLLADQWTQGFSAIPDIAVGSEAVLVLPSGTERYKCTAVFQGTLSGANILDPSGKSLSQINPGGVHMYSSSGSDSFVWVASYALQGSAEASAVPSPTPGTDTSGQGATTAPQNPEDIATSGAGYLYSVPD